MKLPQLKAWARLLGVRPGRGAGNSKAPYVNNLKAWIAAQPDPEPSTDGSPRRTVPHDCQKLSDVQAEQQQEQELAVRVRGCSFHICSMLVVL
jgi:hypothetical protein